MPFDKLWAPWRIEYIINPKEESCFFCKYSSENNDRKRLILFRGKNAFVIMNFFPYNNGHIMITPYLHTSEFSELNSETKLEMFNLIESSTKIIREEMRADGFNIGINLGSVAGAGVKDHLHIHVVPRWNGDTNFMPVTAGTKVISEGLEETWEKLRDRFDLLKR
ncbi:MAG: HIT domain-containing protein [Candidatus Marinimicrobia bacterium]|nr:HIT domain-containing protein [Candidatus Neomarinimicrobiota bacterium]